MDVDISFRACAGRICGALVRTHFVFGCDYRFPCKGVSRHENFLMALFCDMIYCAAITLRIHTKQLWVAHQVMVGAFARSLVFS